MERSYEQLTQTPRTDTNPNHQQNIWETAKNSRLGMMVTAGVASAVLGAGASGTAIANSNSESEPQTTLGNTPERTDPSSYMASINNPASFYETTKYSADTAIAGISLASKDRQELIGFYTESPDKKTESEASASRVSDISLKNSNANQSQLNPDQRHKWLKLKRHCTRAGLARPKARKAEMNYPGSRHGFTQQTYIDAQYMAMPEVCNDKFIRVGQLKVQIQNEDRSKWLNMQSYWETIYAGDKEGRGKVMNTPNGHEGDWIYNDDCRPVRALFRNKVFLNKKRRTRDKNNSNKWRTSRPLVAQKVMGQPIKISKPC